jgi:2TM domain
MDEEQKQEQARRKVARLKAFYAHLTVYVLVITMLFFINLLTPGPWWFQWPLIGWGIAVALQALGVYGFDRVFGPEWEQKKYDEFMKH